MRGSGRGLHGNVTDEALIGQLSMRSVAVKTAEPEYQPFPNQPWRNRLQAGFEVRILLRLLRVPLGGRILELGCGRGIALAPLAALARPTLLVGLDNDRGLLKEAEHRAAEAGVIARLICGDVRAMPVEGDSFEVVVDFGTCYHVTGRRAALAEVQRVLVPGGLFVCESPIAQLLAHPGRNTWRRLPWSAAPLLVPLRRAGLWSSRVKLARAPG